MKGRPITTEEFERMLAKTAAGLAPLPTKRKPEGQRKRKAPKPKPRSLSPQRRSNRGNTCYAAYGGPGCGWARP